MKIQDKMYTAKDRITAFRKISKMIIDDSATIDGRKQIMEIVEGHPEIGSVWESFNIFVCTLRKIYHKYDPTFYFPRLQSYNNPSDQIYAGEYGYLLLKIDALEEEDRIVKIVGLSSLYESYQNNTEHTVESAYRFVMDCIEYFSEVARKMLTLPIFQPNEVVFLSLLCHYYLGYNIETSPSLNHITDWRRMIIYNDFKRMVFETNGAHPLSVRGNLPVLSHYAMKRARGHYRWNNSSAPLEFVKDMKSNKALNLRKAFGRMEELLSGEYPLDENSPKISFGCTVGVSTQAPHYDRYKKIHCISDRPMITDNNSLQLGIFSACGSPRETTFDEKYIGWVDLEGTSTVYKTYEAVFNYFEDDIVDTLEDNYDFLLEKMPELNRERLQRTMLEYIVGGR